MNSKYPLLISLCLSLLLLGACSEDDAKTALGNDCIKRSICPNIVGEQIEFAYAMAIPPEAGKLASVEVIATIPGADGTYLDPNSYRTNSSGQDVGIQVAAKSSLQDNKCVTTFIVDTCAATLRYYYKIPEEARGRQVAFTFSVKSNNGEKQSYQMGPYQVGRMDMVKGLNLTSGNTCYVSIKEMKVYTAAEIAGNTSLAAGIDLIYGYSSKSTVGQAFYAPSASKEYLEDVVVPAGSVADTKLVKVWALRDQQLSDLQWAVFVDDVDFEKQSFDHSADFYLGLKAENGVWVETADKKFRAYIYINTVAAGKMTVSIKRYTI